MKEKDSKTIWQVPKYLPYVQPNLTDEVLRAAETQLGYKLPQEYIDILKIQNGGYIRFTIKEIAHREIFGIGPYFPSITDCDWSAYKEYVSFELKGLIPFDGDGHWYICFDYRKNETIPQITFIDTECDLERTIANNFHDYLQLLEIDTEDEYVIETNDTLDEILNHLSKILKITFEEPDYCAHGYPEYKAEFEGSYVWISPNKAPSGFIREEDSRYEELKSLMDTTSLRFPELSENALLISVSDENERTMFFEELIASGIKIRQLKEFV
jgi:hypothetical protein